MADLNPLRIEDFPEVTNLLSTDRVVLFTNNSGNLMPYLVELSAFSEYVLSAGELAALENRVEELEKKYSEVERQFNNTYVTPVQVKAEYCTIDSYNDIKADIETIEAFKNGLSSKASGEYAEASFSNIKRKAQDMKRFVGSYSWETTNGTGKGYKWIAVATAKKGAFAEE